MTYSITIDDDFVRADGDLGLTPQGLAWVSLYNSIDVATNFDTTNTSPRGVVKGNKAYFDANLSSLMALPASPDVVVQAVTQNPSTEQTGLRLFYRVIDGFNWQALTIVTTARVELHQAYRGQFWSTLTNLNPHARTYTVTCAGSSISAFDGTTTFNTTERSVYVPDAYGSPILQNTRGSLVGIGKATPPYNLIPPTEPRVAIEFEEFVASYTPPGDSSGILVG